MFLTLTCPMVDIYHTFIIINCRIFYVTVLDWRPSMIGWIIHQGCRNPCTWKAWISWPNEERSLWDRPHPQQFVGPKVKFGFSEKARKFEKVFVVLLTRAPCSVHAKVYLSKSQRRFFKTYVVKLYYTNFNYMRP